MKRWLVVLPLLLAGCGGGKEITPLTDNVRQSALARDEADGAKLARRKKPKKPKKPDPVTKQLQPGDTWHYTGTGTITNLDTGEVTSFTVERTAEILDKTVISPQNVSCKVNQVTTVVTVNGQTGSGTLESYFTQDANGNLFAHGVLYEDQVSWIASSGGRYLVRKSPMRVGQRWGTEHGQYADGTPFTWTERAVGIETVNVGGTTYRAFRLETNLTIRSRTAVYTSWYVPEIVANVQEDDVATGTGQRTVLRMVLSLTPQSSRFQRVPVGQENPELNRLVNRMLQVLHP